MIEERKAALVLDSMGEKRMEYLIPYWNIEVERMQYEKLKFEFAAHFQ